MLSQIGCYPQTSVAGRRLAISIEFSAKELTLSTIGLGRNRRSHEHRISPLDSTEHVAHAFIVVLDRRTLNAIQAPRVRTEYSRTYLFGCRNAYRNGMGSTMKWPDMLVVAVLSDGIVLQLTVFR